MKKNLENAPHPSLHHFPSSEHVTHQETGDAPNPSVTLQQQLATVLSEQPPPVPMRAYELNRHLRKWLQLRFQVRPGYQTIAATLPQLGWSKIQTRQGPRWMPPS